jgi:hypothetical protein
MVIMLGERCKTQNNMDALISLYKVPKQAKPIYGDRCQNSG